MSDLTINDGVTDVIGVSVADGIIKYGGVSIRRSGTAATVTGNYFTNDGLTNAYWTNDAVTNPYFYSD
jgi:hypothetical protein